MERDVPDPVVQPGRYLGENSAELIVQPVIVLVDLNGRRIESTRYTFNIAGSHGGALVPANEKEHRRIQRMIDDSQMRGPFAIDKPKQGS